MRKYTPTYQHDPANMPGYVATLAAGAVLTGAAAYFISQIYYLVILYPLLMGLAGVALLQKATARWKIHQPLTAVVLGLLTGLLLYGAYHYTSYLLFRYELGTRLQEAYELNPVQAGLGVNAILYEETGSAGLFGYLKLSASQGLSFSTQLMIDGLVVGEMPPITLYAGWAWLYWLVEVVLIAGLTGLFAYEKARMPFSTANGDWYGHEQQVGSVPIQHKSRFLHHLEAGQVAEAGALLVPEGETEHPTLEVYLQQSRGAPQGEVLLVIKETRRTSAQVVQRELLARWEMGRAEYAIFYPEITLAPA